MKLELTNNSDAEIEPVIFQVLLEKAEKIEVAPKEEATKTIELLLTNNAEIQSFNKKYRGKDQPTDVLSFAFQDDELLGQIAISVERARIQAEEIGQSLEEELKFLFVHGLLHLFAYDHESPEGEEIMLQKAYKILGRAT